MVISHKYEYILKCPYCGEEYIDDGIRLSCDVCIKEKRSVILEYVPVKETNIFKEKTGIAKYQCFLPGNTPIEISSSQTITFKSKKFAKKYGFENLYFTCTGENEALGIHAITGSFKELEAICVMHRLRSFGIEIPLVLSSAGNTARAFAYYAAKYGYPILIIVPQASRRFLWLPDEEGLYDQARKYVRVVTMKQPAKFLHASMLAKHILSHLGEKALDEGGFFNIGRICGLGSCALNFYDETGLIPNFYVQAVGSGVGALAALRSYALVDPVRSKDISYLMIQNLPYDPLVQAVNNDQPFSPLEHYQFIDTVCSPMLTSGNPALDYPGGLLDAKNNGIKIRGYSVTNNDIYKMHYEVGKLENIHILLPAAAAISGLIKAREAGVISGKDIVQVNITGCGEVESKNKSGFFYLADNIKEAAPEQISFGGRNFEQWFTEVEKDIMNF